MTKQELARKRNFFKFKLLGISVQNTDDLILTEIEQNQIEDISILITLLISNFDNNSRELGLNVPEFKCWCGKEGKYPANSRQSELGYITVCKKHIEDE